MLSPAGGTLRLSGSTVDYGRYFFQYTQFFKGNTTSRVLTIDS